MKFNSPYVMYSIMFYLLVLLSFVLGWRISLSDCILFLILIQVARIADYYRKD